jgi:hypothetical protein
MTAVPLGITDRGEWEIHDRRSGLLGIVDYYPRWRRHVFTPERGSVFSPDCLAALAEFVGNAGMGK